MSNLLKQGYDVICRASVSVTHAFAHALVWLLSYLEDQVMCVIVTLLV